MAFTIDDLFTPASVAEWESAILTVATTLGLSTTSWVSGAMVRSIVKILAFALAAVDNVASVFAKGGFLDTAATVTPEGGPGWLDLVALFVYNVIRQAATRATGVVTITNSSATNFGTIAAGGFHISSTSTGKTYTNVAAFTLGPSSSVTPTFQADIAGSGGTAAPHTINNVISSLIGVTCDNASALVGSDAETNSALVIRCRAKLGSLSPNGPLQAYYYFATTAYQLLLAQNPPVVLAGGPITRASAVGNRSNGTVVTTIANAAGAPVTGDVTLVDGIIQANCVPLAVTAITQAATNHGIAFAFDVYVPAAYDIASTTTTIVNAITSYISGLPIGGLSDPGGAYTNVVPFDAVIGVIFDSLPAGVVKQATGTLNGAAANVSLATTEVATVTSITITRHPV